MIADCLLPLRLPRDDVWECFLVGSQIEFLLGILSRLEVFKPPLLSDFTRPPIVLEVFGIMVFLDVRGYPPLSLLLTASILDSFVYIVLVWDFKGPWLSLSAILTVLLFYKMVEFREVLGVAFKKGLFSESVSLTEALLAPNLDGPESLLMESLDVRALDSFSISLCRTGSF